MFDSFWKSFELRFNGILSSLARHKDLVDREVVAFDIVEASMNRKKVEEELTKAERDRFAFQLQAVLSWLAVEDHLQEDDLSRLHERQYPSTCAWIIQTVQVREWMANPCKRPILWLWGKPGSGESSYRVHPLNARAFGSDGEKCRFVHCEH